MDSIRLLYTTGDQPIDDVLAGLVGIFEATFPGRIRSYYLVGSHATGAASVLSDVDLRVIFRERFLPGEEEKMLQVRHACRQLCPVALDCPPLDEHRMLYDADWLHEPLGIRAKGILLYGDDIRTRWSPPDFDAYLRNIAPVPVFWVGNLRRSTGLVSFPLTYPDPTGEFYGYDEFDARANESSLKLWVHAVGFAASAKLALQAGQMVTSKDEWLFLYRQAIDDEWTPWLTAVYRTCAQEWSYRIPAHPVERSQLRALCCQTLAFENHYLLQYLAYLLEELWADDPTRHDFAYRQFQKVLYPDMILESVLQKRWPDAKDRSAVLARLPTR